MNKHLEINTLNRPQTQKFNSISLNIQKNSNNKLQNKSPIKNKTFIQEFQKFQPKPKQYCCLYHYTQGKNTKGISPCYNHVSNGIINPITTLTKNEILKIKKSKINPHNKIGSQNQQQLIVNADPYDFNFHTHFLNEIQHRGSKPKQLVKPRVYVQKIYPKNFIRKDQSFLYPKKQTKAQFIEIYNLYKLFAEKTQFKTQKQLKDDVISFAKQNNIKTAKLSSQLIFKIDKVTAGQYLFSKQDFISYLMSHSFSQKHALNFWQIIYNKERFMIPQRSESSLPIFKHQFISMKAFIYNFIKFYLQQDEYYRNVFSEPALRQRLIDLRLLLQPWYAKNIILKIKLKKWKITQFQTAQFLKTSGYQKEYDQMLRLIQDRNRIYFLMRTLSKSIYDLTDQKNFGMDVWNNRLTFLIEQKSDSLICFMEFIQKFKEQLIRQQLENSQQHDFTKIKITDLIQFLNTNKKLYGQLEQKWIIKWIRNIYKYLFHFKDHDQLYIDPINYKICCKSSIIIQKQLISQFIHYKSTETDNLLEVLRNLTQQIQEKLYSMPQLQGKKKYLVECNYVIQTLLRIIKRNNFSSFYTLNEINKIVEEHWFDFQNCCENILSALRTSPQQFASFNIDQKFWRDMFTPINEFIQCTDINQSLQKKQPYSVKDALDKYDNVKNALGIKNSVTNKISLSQNSKKIINIKPSDKQIKNLPKKAGQFLQRVKKQKQQVKQKFEQFDWGLKYKRNQHQCCSQGYCLHCQDVISTEVSSTIGRVEDMENYLMDLLRDF